MRVVHTNTQTYGGAAVASIRLHRALLDKGVSSEFVSRYGIPESRIPHHFYFQNAKLRYFLRKKATREPLYSLIKFLQNLRPHPHLVNKPGGYEIFSPMPAYTVPHYTPWENADIVHLHWVNNFADHVTFLQKLQDKRLVWTLHDMNPFTGGCHHSDGCVKFRTACTVCPQLKGTIDDSYSQLILQNKEKALENFDANQVVIASPSRWLLELSASSRILGRFRHEHIENPTFDRRLPPDFDRRASRVALGLPPDKKIVLFVCDNIVNPRKGIQQIFDAAPRLRPSDAVHFVAIGHPVEAPAGVPITFAGSISDVDKLAQYFATADVFIIPSLAENAPLVVIEALTMGTPVAGSQVGGIPGLLNAHNGMLFQPGDIAGLTSTLESMLFQKTYSRAEIARDAWNRFNPGTVADDYIQVYKKLMG